MLAKATSYGVFNPITIFVFLCFRVGNGLRFLRCLLAHVFRAVVFACFLLLARQDAVNIAELMELVFASGKRIRRVMFQMHFPPSANSLSKIGESHFRS